MGLTALRRRDAAALVLATVTALAGLTALLVGDVDLGVDLGYDEDGFARVMAVDPESIAASFGFAPGQYILFIGRRDGTYAASRQSPYRDTGAIQPEEASGYLRLVTEIPPDSDIGFISTVSIDPEQEPKAWLGPSLSRTELSSPFEASGVLYIIGAVLGVIGASLVAHGRLGETLAAEGTVAGAALATALMSLPLAYAGIPGSITAGTILPGLGLLPLAWSLADAFPDQPWRSGLKWLAVGLVAVAMGVLLQGITHTDGSTSSARALLLATALVVPTLGASLAGSRTTTARLRLIVLGALPAMAVLTHVGQHPEIGPLLWASLAVVGWQLLPATLRRRLAARMGALRPGMPPVEEQEPAAHESPAIESRRELASLAVGCVTLVLGLTTCCGAGAVIGGALGGAFLAFALHRGLLGRGWARGAIPIGVAVGVPIMALSFNEGGMTMIALRLLLPGLAALPVAHFLAWRHPEEAWRRPLFGISVLLVVVVALLVLGSSYGGPLPDGPYGIVDGGSRLTIYLALGFIALVPGLGSALSAADPTIGSPISRLDLVAIGLTPGAAMTVLAGAYSPTLWILLLWLAAVIAWRRLTIAPLLRLAQRTQRQRDLAVAAVEAERARLAADIHDDALQELSALVRRLDSAGDAEGAELARSVAERLRAITSDLRLPLLDDLGAGPALEWLVGRFRPLTDGELRLERSDPTRPPSGVELAIFRVAQEAIANAVKHGKPPITVRYRVDEAGAVSLSIDDQGPGIAPDAPEVALRAGHLGVANMQQRAEQIGALLDIRRWPGGGTHVALEWRPR
jgi:signal transduction histidine kinase